MMNCEGCSAITDKLSRHGYCEKCQRDKQAKKSKQSKQEARKSMKAAGVL